MRLRLFPVACLVSLLGCVAVLGLWIRGYGPDASPAPSTAPAQALLARRLPMLAFNGVAFSDVIDFLRDVSGADIVVNWESLEAAGLDRNSPVTANLSNARMGEVLRMVMVAAKSDLEFTADGNAIFVGLPQDRQRGRVSERPGGGSPGAQAALRQKVGAPLRLTGTWGQVLEHAGSPVALPIRLDRGALKSAGIPLDAMPPRSSLSADRWNYSTADLLKFVLRRAHPSRDVQFQLQGDSVVISTRQKFDEAQEHRANIAWLVIAAIALVLLTAAIALRRVALSERGRRVVLALLFMAAAGAVIGWTRGPPLREKLAGNQLWSLTTHRGVLRLWHGPADPAAVYQQSAPIGGATAPDAQRVVRFAGFAVSRGGSPFNTWVVAVPCWMLVGLALILPALWLAALHRQLRRRNLNLCANCGYDLRHSPERCPECGTPVPQMSVS